MDIATILTSFGISVGGAWWLSQALVNHRLSKDLEDYKSQWKRELEGERLKLSGEVRERVENTLADSAADREYVLEARKRLYQLIGPAKFQLLVACRDASRRVEEHAQRTEYSTNIEGYYGRSTIYRLLRPLAISEVIERQITFADFAVDSSAIDLLIFKRSAFRVFSGASATAKHPNAEWVNQSQHIFYESLSQAAQSLIVDKNENDIKVLSFDEFGSLLNSPSLNSGLLSIINIMNDFTIQSKPIFWQRLVAYAYICREHIKAHGMDLYFDYQPIPVKPLLLKSRDEYIQENIDKCGRAVFNARLEKL